VIARHSTLWSSRASSTRFHRERSMRWGHRRRGSGSTNSALMYAVRHLCETRTRTDNLQNGLVGVTLGQIDCPSLSKGVLVFGFSPSQIIPPGINFRILTARLGRNPPVSPIRPPISPLLRPLRDLGINGIAFFNLPSSILTIAQSLARC
jgi:hypothetical protein